MKKRRRKGGQDKIASLGRTVEFEGLACRHVLGAIVNEKEVHSNKGQRKPFIVSDEVKIVGLPKGARRKEK